MTSETPWALFPDVESAVMDVVEALCPNVGRVTPTDFTGLLPFLHVYRFAGSDNRFTDTADIFVNTFAASPSASRLLAEQVRQQLLAFPHATADGVIDRVVTAAAPAQAAWSNLAVYRWTATYRVTTRRPTS